MGYNVEFSQDGIHWTAYDPISTPSSFPVEHDDPFGSKAYVRLQLIYGDQQYFSAFSNVVTEKFANQDGAVELSAAAQAGAIAPSWPVDDDPAAYGYEVYRREGNSGSWGQPINSTLLNATSTGYTDTTVQAGTEYQYMVTRSQTASYMNGIGIATGYIDAAIDLPTSATQGTIELIVDDNSQFLPVIAPQLAQFEQALIGDGWAINLHYASESDTPSTIHNLIQTDYDNDVDSNGQHEVKQVLLIGDLQTPLSVPMDPDGHFNDPRNFPMDAYYGDVVDANQVGSWDPVPEYPTVVNGVVQYYSTEALGTSNIQLGVGRIDFEGFLDPNNNGDEHATRDIAFECS